jgi:hypothetical protein
MPFIDQQLHHAPNGYIILPSNDSMQIYQSLWNSCVESCILNLVCIHTQIYFYLRSGEPVFESIFKKNELYATHKIKSTLCTATVRIFSTYIQRIDLIILDCFIRCNFSLNLSNWKSNQTEIDLPYHYIRIIYGFTFQDVLFADHLSIVWNT